MYFILIVIIVFVAILASDKKTPEKSGKNGEEKVARILSNLSYNYTVLNDVIIPSKYGTTQIDHLVISEHGIFVIETKNYSGWIFGNERSEKWKEVFLSTSAYFGNPIKQNWGHVYALSELLHLNIKAFIPIVVFSNSAKLHVDSTLPVVNMNSLLSHNRNYQGVVLTSEQVKWCANELIREQKNDSESAQEHVQYVKQVIKHKENELRQGLCPKCDGKLVLRNGRYGQFYGCSNYPRCKYTCAKRE